MPYYNRDPKRDLNFDNDPDKNPTKRNYKLGFRGLGFRSLGFRGLGIPHDNVA